MSSDDFYLLGVFTSVFIGIIFITNTITILTSQRASNLKKIGVYYNYWDGTFSRNKPNTFKGLLLYTVYLLIVCPFFSWVSVAIFFIRLFSNMFTKLKVPDEIIKIQYLMNVCDLNAEELEMLLRKCEEILRREIKL